MTSINKDASPYDISDEKKEAFICELTALHTKYGIVVAGCGCCGSPFLENATDGAYECNGTDIRWIRSLDSNQSL